MIPQPSLHDETNNQNPTPDTCSSGAPPSDYVHWCARWETPQGHNVLCLSSFPISFYASLLGWLPISILENKTSATNTALFWVLWIILENYGKLGSMGSLGLWLNRRKDGDILQLPAGVSSEDSLCALLLASFTVLQALVSKRPLLYSLLHLPGFWQTLVTEGVIKCNNYPCSWLSDKYL